MRRPTPRTSAKLPKKIKMTVAELLVEYERLCAAEKNLTKLANDREDVIYELRRNLQETAAKLRKYESMAGIAVQASLHVNMRQLAHAYAGAVEVMTQLRMARDASLALVDAALTGADPTRVHEAALRLAATGSAVGIDVPKALPKAKKKGEHV
jgi:hypothetical protein